MSERDMRLPAGKTCSDCVHFRRCEGLFQCPSNADHCDFSPSRFVSREIAELSRIAAFERWQRNRASDLNPMQRLTESKVVRCRNCGEMSESFSAIFMCPSCRIEICDKCKNRHMIDNADRHQRHAEASSFFAPMGRYSHGDY